VAQNKNVVLGCSGWKDMFNLEDTLFAGAVIDRIHDYFVIHDDASLMAQQIYKMHENNLFKFVQNTTHWHRLAAYGLQKDLQYCISIDVADVLPIYKNGELVVNE
jgi:2-phosphosulfolactate phosphatase